MASSGDWEVCAGGRPLRGFEVRGCQKRVPDDGLCESRPPQTGTPRCRQDGRDDDSADPQTTPSQTSVSHTMQIHNCLSGSQWLNSMITTTGVVWSGTRSLQRSPDPCSDRLAGRISDALQIGYGEACSQDFAGRFGPAARGWAIQETRGPCSEEVEGIRTHVALQTNHHALKYAIFRALRDTAIPRHGFGLPPPRPSFRGRRLRSSQGVPSLASTR